MKLIKFDNYDEYKSTQAAANRQKFHNVFAETEELRRIAEDLQGHVPDARRGLCHGVRNGYEVRYLRGRVPGLDLVGTDISETAAAIPNCIGWDMHEVKPEWVGATDFIYWNSWDHSYDPRLLFRRWTGCLSDRGRQVLEAPTDVPAHRTAAQTHHQAAQVRRISTPVLRKRPASA
jgi:hypothetical protein